MVRGANARQGVPDTVEAPAVARVIATTPPTPQPDKAMTTAAPGHIFGSYVLEAELGQGAMGQVFRARHVRIGHSVAIKVLRPEHAANDELVLRFFYEAQVVNQINHEHIVQVLDFVNEPQAQGGRVYCVMELLEGESLSAALAQGALPLGALRLALAQVASALEAAHRRGVIHRDIKPDNIFLVRKSDGSLAAKVLDFGVAKLIGEQATVSQTQAGVVVGTPKYMSPEQAASLPIDPRSDIYSLGTVAYEALAGTAPFTAAAFGQLVVQIITLPPPPLPSETPRGEPIPARLREVVMRSLSKQPEDRPQSLAEIIDALRNDAKAPPRSAPRRARRWVAVPLALACVALLFGLRTRNRTAVAAPKPERTAARHPPVVVAPPAPAPPAEVRFRIDSTPTGAEVVDSSSGASWGTTPLEHAVARGTQLSLRLSHAGYQPVERSLRADENAQLDIALVPSRPRPAVSNKRKSPSKSSHGVSQDGLVDPFSP